MEASITNALANFITDASIPYDFVGLKKIRLDLTMHIEDKQYAHYTAQLMEHKKVLFALLGTPYSSEYMEDEYWTKSGKNAESSWWQQDTTGSKHFNVSTYKMNLKNSVTDKLWSNSSGIARLVGLNLKSVLGTAYDKLKQSDNSLIHFNVLVQSLTSTYFEVNEKKSSSRRLWPVWNSIDYSYLLQKNNGSVQTIEDSASSAVAGTGPFMLKLLQQIGSSDVGTDPEVKKLLQKVNSRVPGLSPEELEFVVKTLKTKDETLRSYLSPNSLDAILTGQSSLGSASLAEVYNVKDSYGEEVVLKLCKPVCIFYFLCEIDQLLCETWKEISRVVRGVILESHVETHDSIIRQTRQMLLFLITEFCKEFDYSTEHYNTVAGRNVYAGYGSHPRIDTIRGILCSTAVFPVLLQSKAPGKSLENHIRDIDKITDPTTKVKKIAMLSETVQDLASWWVEVLFFRCGYFHADMHAGNIYVSEDKKTGKVTLTLIDFGSAGKLALGERCRMLKAIVHSQYVTGFNTLVENTNQVLKQEKKKNSSPVEDSRLSVIVQTLVFNSLAQYKDPVLLDLGITDRKLGLFRFTDLHRMKHLPEHVLKSWATELGLPETIRKHHNNVKQSMRFVRNIQGVCMVDTNNESKTKKREKELAMKLLRYDEFVSFKSLFMNYIKHATYLELGLCTSNSTVMFGRAVSYLGSAVQLLFNTCGDAIMCPHWTIDVALQNAAYRNMYASTRALLNVPCTKPAKACTYYGITSNTELPLPSTYTRVQFHKKLQDIYERDEYVKCLVSEKY